MILTDKCKKDFEKWYNKDTPKKNDGWTIIARNSRLLEFYRLTESMRYGVFEDFFDSVGIWLVVEEQFGDGKYYDWCINTKNNEWYHQTDFKTRGKAREKSLEKANEIHNNRQ